MTKDTKTARFELRLTEAEKRRPQPKQLSVLLPITCLAALCLPTSAKEPGWLLNQDWRMGRWMT